MYVKTFEYIWFNVTQKYVKAIQRVGGIVVSIAAFQAVDPGSIPGRRKDQTSIFIFLIIKLTFV